jgi:zinc transport system ATP-binding protein
MPMSETVLAVKSGSVVLDSRPVIERIDFHLEHGEFLALLGDNGAGKTTLVKAVLGLLPLTDGEVELFGKPLHRFHDWQRIGYVPQRFSAATGVPASVDEVVVSGRVHRVGLRRYGPRDRAATKEALEAVGLERLASEPIATLSGGQQQRALIARALAGEPDLLVLDEPAAGIDVESQETFAEILERLKERGRSVILVAHGLGPLESLVSRVVVLEAGRVSYDGPPLLGQAGGPHLHVYQPVEAHRHEHHHFEEGR